MIVSQQLYARTIQMFSKPSYSITVTSIDHLLSLTENIQNPFLNSVTFLFVKRLFIRLWNFETDAQKY